MHERKTYTTRVRLRDRRRFEHRIFLVCVCHGEVFVDTHVPLVFFPDRGENTSYSASTADSLLHRSPRGKTDAIQIEMRSRKSRATRKHNSVGRPENNAVSVRIVDGIVQSLSDNMAL